MGILRRPGSVAILELPSEADLPEEFRTKLHVPVLRKGEWRDFQREGQKILKRHGEDDGTWHRYVIGKLVTRIENLQFDDGASIDVVLDDQGYLAASVADEIPPSVLDEIAVESMKPAQLSPRDVKNLKSPPPHSSGGGTMKAGQ